MKSFFRNVILFIALGISFSSLTGCSATSSPQNGAVQESKSNTGATETKKVDYPARPQTVAQTDIKFLHGTSFKLADKKGKVVLVNMWATWCGPCRKEMPALIEMQETYRDKGFEVIGLDVDNESADEIKAFAAEMKLNYQLGWADEAFFNQFNKVAQGNGAIPQTILFNRDGNMTGIFTGGSAKVIKAMRESVEKTVNE